MASWLDEYQNIKTDMERDFNDAVPAVEQLIVYQELIYRIGVLETAKELCSSAPVTTDTKALRRYTVKAALNPVVCMVWKSLKKVQKEAMMINKWRGWYKVL